MADQTERVILDATDATAQAVRSANASLDGIEKKAKTAGKAIGDSTAAAGAAIVNVTDRQQTAINRIVQNVERRVEGLKSPLQQLQAQQERALKGAAGDPAAIQKITRGFRELIDVQKEQAGIGEKLKAAIENPFGTAGAAVERFAKTFGSVGVIAVGVAGALALAGKEVFEFVKETSEGAEQIVNLGEVMGVSAKQANIFKNAASLAGVDVGALTGVTRKLSQTLTDGGVQSDVAIRRLEKLGITVVDVGGNFRSGEDLLRQFSQQIDKFPDHASKVEALTKVFGKGAVDLLPLVEHFAQFETTAKKLQEVSEEELKHQAEVQQRIKEFGITYDQLKLKASEAIVFTVDIVQGKGFGNKSGVGNLDIFTALGGAIASSAQSAATGNQLTAPGRIAGRPDLTVQNALAEGAASIGRGNSIANAFSGRQTIEGLNRKIQELTSDQNALGARIKPGASDVIQKINVAEFDDLGRQIDRLKDQVKDMEEIEAKLRALKKLPGSTAAALLGEEFSINGNKAVGVALKLQEEYGTAIKGNKTAQAQFNQALDNSIRAEVLKNLKEQAAELERQAKARNQIYESILKEHTAYEDVTSQIGISTGKTKLGFDETIFGQQRNAQLQQLQGVKPANLQQEIAQEQDRAQIETEYTQKVLQVKLQAVDDERDAEAQAAQKYLKERIAAGANIEQANRDFQARIAALDEENTEKSRELKISAIASEQQERIAAAIRTAQIIQQADQETYDKLKGLTGEFFDDLTKKGGGVLKALGQTIDKTVLGSVKDVVTSNISAALTQAITGDKTTLVNPSQRNGPLGKIAGALGIGAKPQFSSKLEQPGHLGDVQLSGGAVPVVLVGGVPGSGSGSRSSSTAGGRSAGGGLIGILAGLGAQGRSGGGSRGSSVSSSISYPGFGGADISTPPFIAPGITADGGSGGGGGGGIASDLQGLGLPTSYDGSGDSGDDGSQYGFKSRSGGLGAGAAGILGGAGALAAGGGEPTAGGGIKGLGAGLLGSLGKVNGLIGGPAGLAKLGNLGGGTQGLAGGALLAGGAVLALDGLKRGGITGLGEDIGGGALIGAKFGGPAGALIGAGIGAIAGTIRLFIKGKDQQIVDRVKSFYGLSISKQFAADPLQKIIDSTYGGNITVGLHAPEVIKLLQLYAQSTGQKFDVGLASTPQAVSLSVAGGKTYQNAASVDGTGIGYGGGSATLLGASTIIGGTTAATNGQPQTVQVAHLSLSLNGQSAQDALSGSIASNPNAVASASIQAAANSTARRQTTVATQAPGVLLS